MRQRGETMSILSCCNHCFKPFSFRHKGKTYALKNKKDLIIHSLAIGLFTFGVGGLVYFYCKAAIQKAKQIRHLRQKRQKLPTPLPSSLHSSTKNKKDEFLAQFDQFDHSQNSLNISFNAAEEEYEKVNNLSSVEAIQSLSTDFVLIMGATGQDRYSNNNPWSHSAVQLQQAPFLQNTYVNASWISSKLIAAQAPTLQTVLSFWQMIYENDVSNVIMLTSELPPKGFCYWPKKVGEECLDFAPFKITLIKEQCFRFKSGTHLIQRKFELAIDGKETKTVYQHQIPDWPDFGVISDAEALRTAIEIINKKRDDKAALVHCNAGLGRTGTFSAIDALLDDNANARVNIGQTVANQRLERAALVQTPEQYYLIYQTLAAKVAFANIRKGAEVDVCLDVIASGNKSFTNKMQIAHFGTKLRHPDETVVKLRCYYPNKAYQNKIGLKKLFLPIHLFENAQENDCLKLTYRNKKFRIVLRQMTNICPGFEDTPFEDAIARTQAIRERKIGYGISPKASLFHLKANGQAVFLEKSLFPILKLQTLDAPQTVHPKVTTGQRSLQIEVDLPNIIMSEIDVLLDGYKLIVSAKSDESSVLLNMQYGESIALKLENEYLMSFIWTDYISSNTDFLAKLAEAFVSFENEKLTIRLNDVDLI